MRTRLVMFGRARRYLTGRRPGRASPAASSPPLGHRGQALVEFALILPIMLFLMLGVLDLGRVFFTYEAIANSAREAARQCAISKNLSSSQLGTIATNETGGTLTITAVSAPPCNSGLVAGTPVTVTVSTVYQPVTGAIPGWIGAQTLRATATMVVWQ